MRFEQPLSLERGEIMNQLKSRGGRIGFGLLASLWLVIGGLATNAVWLIAFTQSPTPTPALSHRGTPVAARTPYTVILQESTPGPSGDVSPQGSMTFALRGDGGFVVRYEHLGTPAVIQRTIEFSNGVTVVVDDIREHRTSTLTRMGTSARARMDSARDCIKNDVGEPVFSGQIVAAHEVVAGYDTVKITSSNSTFWLARQLGCAQVKSRAQLSDGVINEQVAILTAAGEPDNALFYVPARYSEVPPSVFYKLDPNVVKTQKLDRSYYARRPPK
jgi:hypothetical protein